MLAHTHINDHFKTAIKGKDTNGFGDKSILAFQGQCASITSFEMPSAHLEFMGYTCCQGRAFSLSMTLQHCKRYGRGCRE